MVQKQGEKKIINILLTDGHHAKIDVDDHSLISNYKWHAWRHPKSGYVYARRRIYDSLSKTERIVYMHRELLAATSGQLVDHKNHDTLDNTRSNIRIASSAQNSQNSRLRRCNTSGFKGVQWLSANRKWRAFISNNGSTLHLGLFKDRVEAAKAYDRAAVKLFGQFSLTNF